MRANDWRRFGGGRLFDFGLMLIMKKGTGKPFLFLWVVYCVDGLETVKLLIFMMITRAI